MTVLSSSLLPGRSRLLPTSIASRTPRLPNPPTSQGATDTQPTKKWERSSRTTTAGAGSITDPRLHLESHTSPFLEHWPHPLLPDCPSPWAQNLCPRHRVPSALGIWGLTSAGKRRGARLPYRWDIPSPSPHVCVRGVKPLQFPRPLVCVL